MSKPDKPSRPKPSSTATSSSLSSATSADFSIPVTSTSSSRSQSQHVRVLDARDAARDSTVSKYVSVPSSGGGGVSLLTVSGSRASSSASSGLGQALGAGVSA